MVKITYYGHACFKIDNGNYSIVIDPYNNGSVPNLTLPKIEANKVLCSHTHMDHNAQQLVDIIDKDSDIKIDSVIVPHDHHNGMKRGYCEVNAIYIEDKVIVHLGDIGCVPSDGSLDKFKNCDVLLAPINGFFTIAPEEAKAITDILKPKILVPMHYYMDQYASGYKDDGQIQIFKSLYPNYKGLDDSKLILDDEAFKNKVVVFRKYEK